MFRKVSAKNRLTNKHLEEEAFNKVNSEFEGERKPVIHFKPELISADEPINLYLIGDLVWTKVRKTKAWPAMITFDPNSGVFFKERIAKGRKYISHYHVQYFGNDILHGWVSKNLLMKFEGKEQILPKQFSAYNKFSTKNAFDSWSKALDQASEALHLCVNSRKLKYIHNYGPIEMTTGPTKVKRKSTNIDSSPKNIETKSSTHIDLKKEDLILKEIQNPIAIKADITRYDDQNSFIDDSMLKSIRKSIKVKNKIRKNSKENKHSILEEDADKPHSKKLVSKKIKTISKEGLDLKVKQEKLKIVEKETKTPNNKVKDVNKKSSRNENKEFVCKICEEVSEDLLLCTGQCFNYFHADCLGLPTVAGKEFKCDECLVDFHTCFSCKQPGHLLKCSHNSCGKFYHTKCLENLPFTKYFNKNSEKFHCSLHQCNYCYDSESPCNNTSKVMQCLRCPTAYHPKLCLVAGSTEVTSSYMICNNHFSPNKTKSHHSRVNVTWCFACSLGGSLICCDNCPASFHLECIPDEEERPLEGETSWKCHDCKNNSKLLYHDIVWVKYAAYRWWPAQIWHPCEVPDNIQRKPHDIGEFPVYFFGSKDYTWVPAHRCFKYQEGDKGGCKGKTSLAHYFEKALEEAKEEFQNQIKERAEAEETNGKRKSKKPPRYGHIKSNRPVTCIRNILTASEWPICTCTVESPCNSDSDCLNQLLYFECNPKTCPSKEKCQNQRMQKCEYVKCKPVKCEGRGWGLFSEQDIKSGDFVIEYVGELIDEETCYKRIQKYHQKDVCDYYFLTIDRDNIIDAYPKGNLSRFMNHSCDPNCITQKWTVNGEMRVGLFAVKDIEKGEELCFNYNLDCLGNEKKQCKCGSKNCSGFLGVRPKSQSTFSDANKGKKNKKKRRRNNKIKKVVHDDDCFICTDGGELILCGRPNCPKSYHMKCLNLEHQPRGRWDCPAHFCDVCGKLSVEFCTICPNSFCKQHKENEFRMFENDTLICDEHTDEDVKNYLEDSDLLNKSNDEDKPLLVKNLTSQSNSGGQGKINSPAKSGAFEKTSRKSRHAHRDPTRVKSPRTPKKFEQPCISKKPDQKISASPRKADKEKSSPSKKSTEQEKLDRKKQSTKSPENQMKRNNKKLISGRPKTITTTIKGGGASKRSKAESKKVVRVQSSKLKQSKTVIRRKRDGITKVSAQDNSTVVDTKNVKITMKLTKENKIFKRSIVIDKDEAALSGKSIKEVIALSEEERKIGGNVESRKSSLRMKSFNGSGKRLKERPDYEVLAKPHKKRKLSS